MGPDYKNYVWAERYRPRGGGISYQMKADGQPGCVWTVSKNIDLFTRTGDGTLHRSSTARERRHARRIQSQHHPVETTGATRSFRRAASRGQCAPDGAHEASPVPGYPAGWRGLKDGVGTAPLPPSGRNRSSRQQVQHRESA